MNKSIVTIALLFGTVIPGSADIYEEYNKIKEQAEAEFNKVRDEAVREYEEYRRKANEEFARFMEQPWQPSSLRPIEKPPVLPSPDPIIQDIDTVRDTPPAPIIIAEVTPVPEPAPQPEPIEPIREIKEEIKVPEFTVNLYGTEFKFRKPDMTGFRLSGGNGSDIARAWNWLNSDRTNNLLRDCLSQREGRVLCDWAYLSLLQKVSETLLPANKNASTLLTGFLFSQSGYKMRFVLDSNKQLHLFYNPTGFVYNTPLTVIDGERFYKFDNGVPLTGSFELCNFRFPGEKSLSFEILRPMKLDNDPSPMRQVTAHYHPDVKVEVRVNKNLMDFYNSYPEATITDDFVTRWAICGNTPASPEIIDNLYPALKEAIKGQSQRAAVNILLHLAQSFEYGYDDEIWGEDRAFFMDESWFYPLSDCEDHAVNFSRMVRDVMGLDAALVYYPGHLAAAVAFTDPDVTGDYIDYKGKRYIVCDPTIFYSNVGKTMPGMDNSEAILIPLR